MAHETQDSKTLEKAMGQVESLDLPLPKEPVSSEVEWPDNVADLDQTQLAAHMTWWTAWSSFIQYHLAQAETNAAAFKEELEVTVQQMIFKSDENDYKNVTSMKAAIGQLPMVQKIKAKLLEAQAKKRMLSALLEGYEKKYSTISREISRRSMEWEHRNG